MAGKSPLTPEVARQRASEREYRLRLRYRLLSQHFLRHHPDEYDRALKKINKQIIADRGRLPGGDY
jgi:thymidylate kinase